MYLPSRNDTHEFNDEYDLVCAGSLVATTVVWCNWLVRCVLVSDAIQAISTHGSVLYVCILYSYWLPFNIIDHSSSNIIDTNTRNALLATIKKNIIAVDAFAPGKGDPSQFVGDIKKAIPADTNVSLLLSDLRDFSASMFGKIEAIATGPEDILDIAYGPDVIELE